MSLHAIQMFNCVSGGLQVSKRAFIFNTSAAELWSKAKYCYFLVVTQRLILQRDEKKFAKGYEIGINCFAFHCDLGISNFECI